MSKTLAVKFVITSEDKLTNTPQSLLRVIEQRRRIADANLTQLASKTKDEIGEQWMTFTERQSVEQNNETVYFRSAELT